MNPYSSDSENSSLSDEESEDGSIKTKEKEIESKKEKEIPKKEDKTLDSTLKPLDPLLTLKLEEEHQLNKEFSLEKFIEKDTKLKENYDFLFSFEKDRIIKSERDNKNDPTITSVSVTEGELEAIKEKCRKKALDCTAFYSYNLSEILSILSKNEKAWDKDPEKEVIPAIKERLKALEETIQLKERLKRLSSISNKFQIRHLFDSWKTSLLKFGLMMDEELLQLKISDIKEVEDLTTLLNFIGQRLVDLSKKEKKRALSILKKPLSTMFYLLIVHRSLLKKWKIILRFPR